MKNRVIALQYGTSQSKSWESNYVKVYLYYKSDKHFLMIKKIGNNQFKENQHADFPNCIMQIKSYKNLAENMEAE